MCKIDYFCLCCSIECISSGLFVSTLLILRTPNFFEDFLLDLTKIGGLINRQMTGVLEEIFELESSTVTAKKKLELWIQKYSIKIKLDNQKNKNKYLRLHFDLSTSWHFIQLSASKWIDNQTHNLQK